MNAPLTLIRRPLRPQYIIARPLTFIRARSAAAALKADGKSEPRSPRTKTVKSKPAKQQALASATAQRATTAQRAKVGSTSNSTTRTEDEEAAAVRQQAERSSMAMEHERQWQLQQKAEEEEARKKKQGEMKEEYKPVFRRVLAAMVAAPIALVSSWILYERVILGKEQRTFPEAPEGAAGDAGASSPAAR